MKDLFNSIINAIKTLFNVGTTIIECTGLLVDSGKDVMHVVKDNAETFRLEEELLNKDKLTKLRAQLAEQNQEE